MFYSLSPLFTSLFLLSLCLTFLFLSLFFSLCVSRGTDGWSYVATCRICSVMLVSEPYLRLLHKINLRFPVILRTRLYSLPRTRRTIFTRCTVWTSERFKLPGPRFQKLNQKRNKTAEKVEGSSCTAVSERDSYAARMRRQSLPVRDAVASSGPCFRCQLDFRFFGWLGVYRVPKAAQSP